jgi:hypothetical protein
MLVCCPMADRIPFINDLIACGYEVKVHFSPVIADASGTAETDMIVHLPRRLVGRRVNLPGENSCN